MNSVSDSGVSRSVGMESDAGSAVFLGGKALWSNGGGSICVAEGSSLFGAGVSLTLLAGSTTKETVMWILA